MRRFRCKRKVRFHVEGLDASPEGILVGTWADHYVLRVPRLIASVGGDSLDLQGDGYREVLIPKSRVLFVQSS